MIKDNIVPTVQMGAPLYCFLWDARVLDRSNPGVTKLSWNAQGRKSGPTLLMWKLAVYREVTAISHMNTRRKSSGPLLAIWRM